MWVFLDAESAPRWKRQHVIATRAAQRSGVSIEQRWISDTDLLVWAVGFGTWEMSTTVYGAIDVDEAAMAVN
jgi:hypothetical protein